MHTVTITMLYEEFRLSKLSQYQTWCDSKGIKMNWTVRGAIKDHLDQPATFTFHFDDQKDAALFKMFNV